MKSRNVKSRTDLTLSELYALERAARTERAREIARLFRAGVNALARFVKHAVSPASDGKGISHA